MSQQAKRSDTPPFSSALILADRESNAAVDKLSLRAAGISKLRFSASGYQTAQYLAQKVSRVLPEETELIVCLPRLEDMTAVQFADLLLSHPLLLHMPLLAIASDPGQLAALKRSGYIGVLLRPFNATTLLNTLHEVADSAQKKQKRLLEHLTVTPGVPAHDTFDKLLLKFTPSDKNAMTPQAAYRHGIKLMRDHRWEEALPYLEKAAADAVMHGDASVALAAFWTAAQEPEKVESCLLEALQAFMESRSWDKAKQVSGRLAENFPAAPSPVLPYLERRARQNQHETVMALVGLARDAVGDEDIAAALAKGGRASLTPALTIATLIDTLGSGGYANVAALLSARAALDEPAGKKRLSWFGGKRQADKSAALIKIAPAASAAAEITDRPDKAPAERKKPQTPGGEPPEKGKSVDVPEAGDRSDKASAEREKSQPPEKGKRVGVPDAGDPAFKHGPVITLLGQSGEESLESSSLGDVWTMVRGTMRILKNKNKNTQ